MRSFKFDRNVRFSFMLPYGVCSQQALMLSVPADDASYEVYSDETTMTDREYACSLNYHVRLRAIKHMVDLGYIEIAKRLCGKRKWENVTYYRFTKAGWYYLTNTPNETVEEERLRKIPRIKNRNKNELSYAPQDSKFFAIQQTLYDLAANLSEEEKNQQLFEEIFLCSVLNYDLSLLATEPVMAEHVQLVSGHRADAFYKCWRLANIEALFKANGYLTSIDRRHIINRTPETKTEVTQMEVGAFCRRTLDKWYASHPASYLYADPLENYSEHIEENWKNTPCFYPVSDIDDTLVEFSTDVILNEKRTTKSYRYLCIGVAVGKEKNYIVHHTRCGETPWAEVIEKNTLGSVQQRINKASVETQKLGAKRSISNALMVCASVAHFAALFSERQNKQEEKKRKYNVGAPYDSVCIIPVCPSGAMQLRGLMEKSPVDFERAVCSYLLQYNGFTKRPSGGEMYDYIYPVSFNGTPVFIGHTMDWNKLTIARDQYEEGRKFFVSCYPEQAKYIRSIMPNVEFL